MAPSLLAAATSPLLLHGTVEPQSDRVLVRLETIPEKSDGGVLLPKSAVKFERYLMGEILLVGVDVSEVEAGKKVHGGRLSFGVFHWTAPLLPATLFGIGTVRSSPSSAPCLLSPVALMILVAFEPRSWCGSMAIVPWLSG
ncbi:hypothetical protein ZWY2020_016299 [Hordeum vulgare]|nr:hypothetical protein ZWY2020_016299 [Hordeum vulgare]